MHKDPRLAVLNPFPPPFLEAQRKAAIVRDIVAHLYQVRPGELTSTRREAAPAPEARHVAMYLGHVVLGLSFRELGGYFGRDRSTVAHACRSIEHRRDNREFDDMIRRLEEAVHSLGISEASRIPIFGCG